ncbi:MAG TPA: glycosyltransferase family 4 protein [Lacibacter sp.]|nr:glycosyltransferase family 4 protein [Lacibacter sp.]HMO88671.1 glycosyltransferase family 4 protein [Lacibacter sp.]
MKKLAIITTHPIQYNAPLFRLLADRQHVELKVFYTWGQSKDAVYDARFGIQRSWDVPLLEGYPHEFVSNVSRHPDSNRFFGVKNPGLIRQLEEEGYDAILVYRWSLYSHLRILRHRWKKARLFFRGDSVPGEEITGWKHFLRKRLLRWVYLNVSKALTVGSANAAYYRWAGLTEHQLLLAPHAVDNNFFQKDAAMLEQKALEERRNIQIPDDAIVFLYAGKFYEVKQLDRLITAFRDCTEPGFRLILVGNGKEEEQLRRLAAADSRIHFMGFRNQSEMPWVYRMGDVFVLPSRSETWGLSVNEAMACGRPALVSRNCGCAPELIVEGVTGFTFDAGNTQELTDQLRRFTDKKSVHSLGQQAHEHIAGFSLECVAAVIEGAVLN